MPFLNIDKRAICGPHMNADVRRLMFARSILVIYMKQKYMIVYLYASREKCSLIYSHHVMAFFATIVRLKLFVTVNNTVVKWGKSSKNLRDYFGLKSYVTWPCLHHYQKDLICHWCTQTSTWTHWPGDNKEIISRCYWTLFLLFFSMGWARRCSEW